MSVASGPNVVASGLVFEYDMSNTNRSWQGKPTTNLYPGLGLAAVQGVSYTYISTDSDGWMKYGLNGTWASGSYPYSGMVSSYSFTGGVYYTTSCWIRTNVPSKFANLFTGMNYVNQPMNSAGTSFSVTSANGDIFVGRQNFCYTSTTSQNGYFVSNPTGDGVTFNSATDFVWIKQGQIEVQPWPTPYTNGTRSSTQAIVDLANNNTLTAASLTYASDNTFSFDGSSNYISAPSTTNFDMSTGDYSIDIWFYPNVLAANQTALSLGTGHSTLYWVLTPASASGAIYFGTGSGGWGWSGTVTTSTGLVTLSAWNNVTIVRSGTTLYIYVNGVIQSTTASFNFGSGQGGTFYIGTYFLNTNNDGSWFNGKISNLRLYKGNGLTDGQVAQNFNALRGRYGI